MAVSARKLQFGTPFGPVTLEGTEEKLLRIYFCPPPARDGRRQSPSSRGAPAARSRNISKASARASTSHMRWEGTDFQKEVWRAMARVPYGKLRTYGEIATAIGKKKAMRAVGGAMGKNPLPILLPCHRVVASGMRIGGFTGGCHIKEFLLRLEKSDRWVKPNP